MKSSKGPAIVVEPGHLDLGRPDFGHLLTYFGWGREGAIGQDVDIWTGAGIRIQNGVHYPGIELISGE